MGVGIHGVLELIPLVYQGNTVLIARFWELRDIQEILTVQGSVPQTPKLFMGQLYIFLNM